MKTIAKHLALASALFTASLAQAVERLPALAPAATAEASGLQDTFEALFQEAVANGDDALANKLGYLTTSLDPEAKVQVSVENTIGIPADVGWIEVQNLGVEFPPHNATTTTSRTTLEQGFVGDDALWHDVTFTAYVSPKDKDAMEALFAKFATGDNIRGSITVNFVNPKDAYKVIWSFELQELTLIRFSQGLIANVEHPETLKFSFTVSPGYVKISA